MSGGPPNIIPNVGLPAWGIRGAWLPVFPRVQPPRLRRLEEHVLGPPRERARSRLLGWLRSLWDPPSEVSAQASIQTLVDAQGKVLALLAIVLARQEIIGCDEFADTLAGLAAVTHSDHPDEAMLLARWASVVKEAAGTVGNPPVRH